MLLALEREDVKTAQKIAIEYGFVKNTRRSRHNYFCKTPCGKVLAFGNVEKLADFLGIRTRAVSSRFNVGNLTWEIGKRKGYRIWRKLKLEDE